MSKYIWIILTAVCLIYANTLHNRFVSDDIPTIVDNPDISKPLVYYYHIPSFVTSLNYLIGGLNPAGYHLVNIAFHAANSALVFLVLSLFLAPVASFWGGLIFATHPVNSEAVTWLSGRQYLFFTFFLLCSFLLYAAATREERLNLKKYLFSLFLYECALLSWYFSLLFPAMIALYDFTFGRWRKRWKLWLGFFALAAGRLLLKAALFQQRAAELAVDAGGHSWTNPIHTTVYSFFSNLWLFIWPAKLTIYHEPSIISLKLLRIELAAYVLLLLSLPFLFKKAKPLFFGIGIFILFLAPTYCPVLIAWLVAERYLYFPAIGFCAGLAFFAGNAFSANNTKVKTAASVFLAVLVCIYSARTIIRNRDWKDHAAIWRATVKVSPFSCKAHNNMGDVYSLEGDLDNAAAEFKKAIELKRDYAEAYHNLAYTYFRMGRVDEAILAYQQAVKLKPQLYQSHTNLAVIYLGRGQKDLARYHLQEAAKFNPQDEGIRKLLAQLGG